MSLPSTYESYDDDGTKSPTMSQEQTFVTRVKSRHLDHSQMRGVVALFRSYFPRIPGKRMSKADKASRWSSYKNRVFQDYCRVINGKLESERALCKRYSNPLSFLKYRLKRNHHLRVSDLNKADQIYYREVSITFTYIYLLHQTHLK